MTIQEEIKALKAEKDAVILAHYYVAPEVQELADYASVPVWNGLTDEFHPTQILAEAAVSFAGYPVKKM